MKQFLELPETIRVPRIDEVPNNESILEKLEARKTANIVEGFILHQKDDDPERVELPFNFYSEININNSKLFELIIGLSKELPTDVSLIFNHIDSEPCFGKYTNKEFTLNFLKSYKKEIISDPFFDIGLIFHSETQLIEIFIPKSKYVKFWGVDERSFKMIMKSFKLKEIEDIEFVDEYPMVRESLRSHDNNVLETENLIEALKKEFT